MSRPRAMLLALAGLGGLAGLPACGDDPCPPMCLAAARLRGACLAEAGLDWAAAGYADAADYRDACETWAWEARQLGEPEAVDRACRQRAATFAGGTCADYTAVDWSEVPGG